MTRKPAFAPYSAHFDKHENRPFDVIYCLYKWSNLIGCYTLQKNRDWSEKNPATVKLYLSVASRGMKTYSESKIELRNLQI